MRIAGYAYQASIYCPGDTRAIAVAAITEISGPAWPVSPDSSTEDVLNLWALRANITRDGAGTDVFPVPVFDNEAHDGCSPDNGYGPGQCGEICDTCRTPITECPNDGPSAEFTDEFTQAYCQAMLWANTRDDEDESAEISPSDWQTPGPMWALDAFAPLSRADITSDCDDFIAGNWDALKIAVNTYSRTAGDCGHDFALSRNGHGAGFFDRGMGGTGDTLQEAAKVYGDSSAWFAGDGIVHLDDETAGE